MAKVKTRTRAIFLATIMAMVTFGTGYALAAISVTNSAETAGGNYVNPNAIAGWSLAATSPTAVGVIPASGTTAASTTVGTPSVLPSSATSYTVGTVTAGDVAQILRFAETTSAPANTEIEITFTLNTGAGTTTTTVYVETQASTVAQTFTFYLDAGSAASSSVTLNFAEQVSQQCSAVGTCP
jgi:hypothetical protein